MKRKKVKFFIGLDVHKKFTYYVVRDIDGNILLESRCASIGSDLHDILEPYLCSCVIGLETNTEIYPVYEHFKKLSQDIRAGNTIQLRSLVGKNDKLDARRLADMLRLSTFPEAYIPDGPIKALRGLVKIRHNTLENVHRLQSQIQAITRKHGLRMPTGETFSKRWLDALQKYIVLNKGGIELKQMYDIYEFVNNKLEQLTSQMTIIAKTSFPSEYKAISSQKGIGPTLTPYLISEICPITRFSSAKKLRRYAGVVPCYNESAGKSGGAYLPKSSSRKLLRYALVQAANCVTKHDENMKAYYKKKKKQKKIHNKAILPVARSISDKVYKVLTAC